jgi:hypothetical protein
MEPGRPPAGWPPAPGGVGSDTYVDAFQCARVSWGPYERGPINMIMETHTNLDAPAKCRTGTFDVQEALASWWVGDADLAVYLNKTLGLNVRHANVDIKTTTMSGTTAISATWSDESSKPSSMASQEIDQAEGTLPLVHRIFWNAHGGIVQFDLRNAPTFSNLQPAVIPTTMNPPMLNSQLPSPFMARATLAPQDSVTGTLVHYGDLQCAQPLP